MRLLAWMVVAWLAGGATATAQPDEDYAALEACAPSTLEAALACLETNLPKADREKLLATPFNELGLDYHFGLGSWIREQWSLWGGGPLYNDMVAQGFGGHPEGASMQIIQLFWLDHHGCTQARAQWAAYGSARQREVDRAVANAPEKEKRLAWLDAKVVPFPHLDCTTPDEANNQ